MQIHVNVDSVSGLRGEELPRKLTGVQSGSSTVDIIGEPLAQDARGLLDLDVMGPNVSRVGPTRGITGSRGAWREALRTACSKSFAFAVPGPIS